MLVVKVERLLALGATAELSLTVKLVTTAVPVRRLLLTVAVEVVELPVQLGRAQMA